MTHGGVPPGGSADSPDLGATVRQYLLAFTNLWMLLQ